MIALKKLYGDELLRLALVLSLLKVNPNDYLEQETQQILAGLNTSNSSDWSLEQESRTLIRPRFVHPKSLDNILINYERELFEELNSLGRYTEENNARIWFNRGLHTYLVNNVATDTVAPPLVATSVADEQPDDVSADDNVAEEVKITDEEEEDPKADEIPQPDAVVTLSADFFVNRSETDVFDEIATRSFDVSEFLVQPDNMQIKSEPEPDPVNVKLEDDDLYSDNAMDEYVSYFASRSEKFNMDESSSVFLQNMADLQEYENIFEDGKDFKKDLEIDIKKEADFEQYLMENMPLDSEVYELAPMFEEELVLDVKRERASTSFTSASSSGVSDVDSSSMEAADIKLEMEEDQQSSGDELTQEDVDIIKVLWKQDVDMGFSLDDPVVQPEALQATKVTVGDDIDKELKYAEDLATEREQDINKVKASLLDNKEEDPWAGLSYTVDTETGEYVLQGELPGDLVNSEDTRFDLLEEALQLVELGDEAASKDEQTEPVEGSSSGSEMLHPAMRHVPHHPLAHYHNQSLMRSMSVEQRWQDLASLLTIPPPPDQYQHYHHHHNISAHGAASGYAPNYHHASLPPPVPEKHPDSYGAAAALDTPYKLETTHPQQHDALYYQNTTTAEMAPPAPTHGQDGFLQSILNDEDLQLMDMAMNEGMYTMRMIDGGTGHHPPPHNHTHMMMTERDSASDSAVSSMGSERVPSLSDSEWCDGGDSAHEFHSSKFRPYESYGRDRAITHPPQKKHHMFGKRCFQEQQVPPPTAPLRPAVKYEPCHEQTTYHHDNNLHLQNEYVPRPLVPAPHVGPIQPTLDLNTPQTSHTILPGAAGCERYGFVSSDRVRHNHTYSAPPAAPPNRDKRVRRLTDGSTSDGASSVGHSLSRDEKRAKALGIPIEVHDIINLPMDEFNERLSKHDLSEAQLSLIRDIRRRGKNKVAAQNCRKRKLDQISSLADEVRTVRERKQRTQRDHHNLLMQRQRLKERFRHLYTHVFQSLRDEAGRPLQSSQYSLQQAADGNVVLVPKMPPLNDHGMNRPDEDMDRKADNYEQ